MTMPDAVDPLNLTGGWHGIYTYPHSQDPVDFAATLDEADGWLSGTVSEIGSAGPARGVRLDAILQGRRSGRTVTLLKLYDGADRGYDTVHYAGQVNDDGTEIGGSWTIPGSWSGTFLMIRARGAKLALSRAATEQV